MMAWILFALFILVASPFVVFFFLVGVGCAIETWGEIKGYFKKEETK